MPEDAAECHFCRKVFSCVGSLDRHIIGVHLKIRPFKCSECDHTCTQKVNLDKHQRYVHGYISRKKVQDRKKSSHKSKFHSGFTMKRRLVTTPNKQSNQNHSALGLALHNTENEAARTCDVCQTVFSFRRSMMKHRTVHFERKTGAVKHPKISRGHSEASLDTGNLMQHNPERMADSLTKGNVGKPACDICGKVFSLRFVMLRHRREHLSKKDGQMGENKKDKATSESQTHPKKKEKKKHQRSGSSCDICQLVFPLRTSMVRHRQVHFLMDEGVKKMGRHQTARGCVDKAKSRCDICNKAFAIRLHMFQHRKLHFSNKDSPVEDDETDSVNLNIEDESLMDKSEEATVTDDSPTDVETTAKKHTDGTCDICGKTYCSIHNMLRHRKTHLKPSKTDLRERTCTICNRVLADKYNLQKHLNSAMHSQTKKPEIHVSPRFSLRNNEEISSDLSDSKVGNEPVIRHFVDQDESKKIDEMMRSTGNSKCLICCKKFVVLKRHVQVVHLKIRPHKCKFCGYAFHQKGDLTKHLQRKQSCRTERPVQNQRMASKDRYRRHWNRGSARSLLRKSDSISKTCPICTKVFFHRSVMLRHKRLDHLPEPENSVKENEAEAKKTPMQEHILPKSTVMNNQEIDLDDCKFEDERVNTGHIVDEDERECKIEDEQETGHIVDEDKREKIDEMMSSTVNLKCLICHKRFTACWMLKIHVISVHLNLQPYKCKVCGLAFQQKGNLGRHVQLKHSSVSTDRPVQYKRMLSRDKHSRQMNQQSTKRLGNRPDMNVHVSPKSSVSNDQEINKDLDDSKMMNEPETRHIVDEDQREKIDSMMRSTRNSKCLICHKKFATCWTLRLHVNAVHLNLRPYKCQFCGFASQNRFNLGKHVNAVHLKLKPYTRKYCKHAFAQKSDLKSHLEAGHGDIRADSVQDIEQLRKKVPLKNIECDICKKLFITKLSMLRHKRTHTSDNKNSGRVPLNLHDTRRDTQTSLDCEENESQTSDIEIPMKSSLSNDQEISRDLSDTKMENESETQNIVDQDERKKINEILRSTKNSKCPICHKKFTRLKPHVQAVHLKIRPYKCKFCGYACNRKADLARHLQRKQSCSTDKSFQYQKISKDRDGRTQNWQTARLQMKADRKNETCSVCSKVFSHRSVMLRHKRIVHTSEPENPVKENAAEAKKTPMQEHILPKSSVMNDQELSRDLDDSKSENESETEHIVDQEEREKINQMMRSTNDSKCLICHKKYATSTGLKVHVNSVHLKLRPYKCKFCGFAFQQKGNMTIHIRRKHSSMSTERSARYQRMASKDKYRRHWHGSSVKRLQNEPDMNSKTCPICSKTFSQKSSMFRHKRLVHTLGPENSVRENEPRARKTEMHEHVDLHILQKSSVMNDQEISRELSDSKMENQSETQHIVDQDERKKINQMMRSRMISECLICHKRFTRCTSLKLHVNAVHLNLQPYKCEFCGFASQNKRYLGRHVQLKHSSLSTDQPVEYQRMASRDIHRRQLTSQSAKRLLNKPNMNIHVSPKSSLSNDQEISKDLDDSKMKNEPETQYIVDQNEREKIDEMMRSTGNTQCLICHKKCIMLKRHVEAVHLKIRPHKCKFCGYAFYLKSSLIVHIQRKHSSVRSDQPVHSNQQSTKRLPNKSNTSIHVSPKSSLSNDQEISKDLDDSKMDNEPETRHIVDQDEAKKIDQMMRSRVILKCLICHKKFSRCASLKLHVNTVHLNLRPYKCKVCGFAFQQKGHLGRHVQLKHSPVSTDRPVQYHRMASRGKHRGHSNSQSAKRLQNKPNMNIHVSPKSSLLNDQEISKDLDDSEMENEPETRHILNQDGREKIDQMMRSTRISKCLLCHKKFTRCSSLKLHVNAVHLNLRPYKCQFCGFTSHHKGNLGKHVDGVHRSHKKTGHRDISADSRSIHDIEPPTKEMQLKNIECDICKKLFITNFSMLRHKRTHTFDNTYSDRVPQNLHDTRDIQNSLNCEESESQTSDVEIPMNDQESSRDLSDSKVETESETEHIVNQDESKKIDEMLRSPNNSKCLICHKKCTRLKLHVQFVHLQMRPYKCQFCGYACSQKRDLARHLQGKQSCSTGQRVQYKRMASKDKYGRDRNWQTRKRLQTKADMNSKTCSICSKVFSHRYIMLRHKRLGHTSEPKNSFIGNESLQESAETTAVIRTPENTSEPEDVEIEDGAQLHVIKSKYTREDRTCGVCHKVFNYRIEMLRHKQLRHPSKPETSVKDSESDPPHIELLHVENRYSREERTCAVCEKLFPYRREMLQHQQMHIAGYIRAMENEEAETEKDPLCIQVETRLEYPTKMDQEERETIKDMLKSDYTGTKCTICQKDFKSRSFLIGHVNGFHLKLKPHKCKYCRHAFALGQNLKAHLKSVHRDIGADSGSVQVSELSTKKAPFKNIECDICKKLFITNFSMLRHKMTHTYTSDNVLGERVLPNPQDANNTTRDTETSFDCEENENQNSDIEIANSQHSNSSGSSDPSQSQSVTSSPSVHLERVPPNPHDTNNTRDTQSSHDCEENETQTSDVDVESRHHNSLSSSDTLQSIASSPSVKSKAVYFKDKVCGMIEKIECDICKKLFITNFSMLRHKRTHTSNNVVLERVSPNLHEANNTTRDPQTSLGCEENENLSESTEVTTQRQLNLISSGPTTEIPNSRLRTSSCSSDSSQSVASSPLGNSSHSSMSVHLARSSPTKGSLMDIRVHWCTKCHHIFTNSEDWKEHLSQHLGGGTKAVYYEGKVCDTIEKIQCDICKKLFITNFSMRQHKRIHTSDNVLPERVPPNLHDVNNTTRGTQTSLGCEENEKQTSGVEIPNSRHCNSSASSDSSQSQSIASLPRVKSSHSSGSVLSVRSMLLDWKEHVKQLGGGTKAVYSEEEFCDCIKSEEEEKPTEDTFSYTCPACKVEVLGSLKLVMHIKEHMMQKSC